MFDMDPWQTQNFLKNFTQNLPFPSNKIYKILFFGNPNLLAKKLVYGMMWEENSPFKMTTLFPGMDGIASGVGFEVNGKKLHVWTLSLDQQLIAQLKNHPKWNEIIPATDGLVFTMYSDENSENVLTNFKNGLNLEIKEDVPILILACRSVEPGVGKSPNEISELLNLKELKRKWCVRSIDRNGLEGVYPGLDWLVEQL